MTKKTGIVTPRRAPVAPVPGAGNLFSNSSSTVPAVSSAVRLPSILPRRQAVSVEPAPVGTRAPVPIGVAEWPKNISRSIRGSDRPRPARSPRFIPSGCPSVKLGGHSDYTGDIAPLGLNGSRNPIGSSCNVVLFCELDLLSFGECAAMRAMGLVGIQRLGRREMAFLLSNQDRWPLSARRTFPVDASALYRFWREALMARSCLLDTNIDIDESMRALQQQRIVAMLSYLQVLERALEE